MIKIKKKFLFIYLLIALLLQNSYAQPGNNDATFNTLDNVPGINLLVNTIAIQLDGKILIGGNVLSSSMKSIARLNPDGTLDSTFTIGTGFNSNISSIIVQTDGKILVCGGFTSFNGITMNRIARLNTDGSLDTTFNSGTGFNSTTNSIDIQSDGKILVGGNFITYNGIARNRFVRLNSDGTLDLSFNLGTGFNSYVNTIAIQSDGKIILGGDFTIYNGISRNRIIRLNSDGTLDLNFGIGTGFNDALNSISIQSDGKIIAGGTWFSAFNGISRNRIARLNIDGSLDTTFVIGTGFDSDSIYSLKIQSNGKIIVGGNFTSYNGTQIRRIARLNFDGTLDVAFNPGGGYNGPLHAIAIQSNGKIIAGGYYTSYGGIGISNISRLNINGDIDNTFNLQIKGFNNSVFSIATQSNGKILVGGRFTSFNGNTVYNLTRLNTDGSIDSTFNIGTGFNSDVKTIAIQSDGKIIVGGGFTSFNETINNYIVRLNSDGTLDNQFIIGAGFNSEVNSIVIESSGKILVGGGFTSYNGSICNKITRLNSNGTIDSTFNSGTGFNGQLFSIAIQSDGKIVAGGWFTSYNGITRNGITRLNLDGSLDLTFNPGIGVGNSQDSRVMVIAIQSDGKIIIGGIILYSYNGTPINNIARINTDGTLDTTFNSQINYNVYSIIIQSNGKILVGGDFNTVDAITMNNIVRLSADSSIDLTFNCETGFDSAVNSIALQSDGKILVGGNFYNYKNITRNRIARLIGDSSLSIQEFVDKIPDIIYPNPNHGLFFIKSIYIGKSYLLMDELGREISSGIINGQLSEVDLIKASSGIYYLKLNGNIIKIVKN